MHFLIQTNASAGSENYHGATRCFRSLASVECQPDKGGEREKLHMRQRSVESL